MEIGPIMSHQNLKKLKYRQSCLLFQFHASFHMCIFVYNAPFVRLLFLLHRNLLWIATSMPPGTNIAIIHVGKFYLSWWMLMYVQISPHVSDWCLNMSLCYTLLIFNSPGSPICLVYRCLRVCAPVSVSVCVPVQGAPVRSMSVWMSINHVGLHVRECQVKEHLCQLFLYVFQKTCTFPSIYPWYPCLYDVHLYRLYHSISVSTSTSIQSNSGIYLSVCLPVSIQHDVSLCF